MNKREKITDVLKKAQKDKAFRKKLLESPEEVLKQEGVETPVGAHIKFIEPAKNTYYYILPAQGEEISDEQLKKLAGGASWDAWFTCSHSSKPR